MKRAHLLEEVDLIIVGWVRVQCVIPEISGQLLEANVQLLETFAQLLEAK